MLQYSNIAGLVCYRIQHSGMAILIAPTVLKFERIYVSVIPVQDLSSFRQTFFPDSDCSFIVINFACITC